MNFPSRTAVFAWKPACWLRVCGDDAGSFLQGQFTQELRGLEIGGARYGLWLNVKGKVVADSFVLRGDAANEHWIGSYFSPAAVIQERLESYVIADDVVLEDQTTAWSGLTLLGAGAANARESGSPGFGFVGRRSRLPHTEWVFPNDRVESVRAKVSGWESVTADDMQRWRIEAGIPAIPSDVGPTDLPNEGGLDVDAISYTKGCYLGQEVMARLKNMGQVRRRLLRVTGGNETVPALPAPLFVGSKQVGELRSAVATSDGLKGLAMLVLMQLKPDSRLAYTPDGAPALQLVDPS